MGLFSKGSKKVAKAAVGVASTLSANLGADVDEAVSLKRAQDRDRNQKVEVDQDTASRARHGESSLNK